MRNRSTRRWAISRKATYFVEQSMEAWGQFVATLASVKEGDGTLLDNTLVFAPFRHANSPRSIRSAASR